MDNLNKEQQEFHKNATELKTVKFMSKDKFNASLKRVQKKHAKNIQALADR